MDYNRVKQLIENTVELIAVSNKSLAEAKERSAKFLTAACILTDFVRDVEVKLPKVKTLVDSEYNQAILSAEGKNITEKKVAAEADPQYTGAREAFEELQALHTYAKSYIKIFDNAHVLYRQSSRD